MILFGRTLPRTTAGKKTSREAFLLLLVQMFWTDFYKKMISILSVDLIKWWKRDTNFLTIGSSSQYFLLQTIVPYIKTKGQSSLSEKTSVAISSSSIIRLG